WESTDPARLNIKIIANVTPRVFRLTRNFLIGIFSGSGSWKTTTTPHRSRARSRGWRILLRAAAPIRHPCNSFWGARNIYARRRYVNGSNCLIKKVLEMGIVASNKKVLEINETCHHWQQPAGGRDEAHDATAAGSSGRKCLKILIRKGHSLV